MMASISTCSARFRRLNGPIAQIAVEVSIKGVRRTFLVQPEPATEWTVFDEDRGATLTCEGATSLAVQWTHNVARQAIAFRAGERCFIALLSPAKAGYPRKTVVYPLLAPAPALLSA